MAEYKEAKAIRVTINKEIEERYKAANPLGNDYGTGYINGLTTALSIVRNLPSVWVDAAE